MVTLVTIVISTEITEI